MDYADGRSLCSICVPDAIHQPAEAQALLQQVLAFFSASVGLDLEATGAPTLELMDRNSLQVCKYASMQVCKVAVPKGDALSPRSSGELEGLAPEQRPETPADAGSCSEPCSEVSPAQLEMGGHRHRVAWR